MSGHPMNLMEVAEKFGGWVFAFALLVDRFVPILPAILNRMVPQLQQKQRAQEERLDKELDAKIAREKEEQDHRHTVENRLAIAVEALQQTNQNIEKIMGSIADRLNGLEYAHKDIPHRVTKKKRKVL